MVVIMRFIRSEYYYRAIVMASILPLEWSGIRLYAYKASHSRAYEAAVSGSALRSSYSVTFGGHTDLNLVPLNTGWTYP